MQTSKDVIDNILRGGSPDRIGLFDFFWPQTLKKWRDEEGYPVDDKGEPRDPYDYFRMDMGGMGAWFQSTPLVIEPELIEESDEWKITKDGAGAYFKNWKERPGTPEHMKFSMTSREVWECDYREHLLETNPNRVNKDDNHNWLKHRRKNNTFAYAGSLHVWETMRGSLGDICMYESLLCDPGWVRDFNRVYTDFYKNHFQLLFDLVGKPDGVMLCEDLGYKNGLFCSPDVLKKLIFPYYAEMTEFFHALDLPVILHTCGGIEAALPMIVDVGFDALHAMEVKAGCDVLRFAKNYGDRIALVGGMDVRIFETNDRNQVRTEVERITRGIKNLNSRYIFGSDHSISTNITLDTLNYALEVYRENMMY